MLHSFVVRPQVRTLHHCSVRRANAATSAASAIRQWLPSHPPSKASVSDVEVNRLAARPRRPLTLADLVKHGKPPLSEEALIASANFTLSLLPARLAHRITALRNLPYIVVSNPSVNKIYNNYLHSLSTLEPFYQKEITTIEEEYKFTEAMADLVRTHSNTIPILAKGFSQCRKYVDPVEVASFLDQHLRARIGTRLVAEQHLALHVATKDHPEQQYNDSHIGVIDTALRPADIVLSCQNFVGEICELKYGIRPSLVINGDPDAEFAHIPMHLEYIITELLKNAFRATIESGNERYPIEVTIAAAPDVPSKTTKLETLKQLRGVSAKSFDYSEAGLEEYCADPDIFEPLNHVAPCITLRIRDRGGGISPETLPNIWSYSFTTFNADDADNGNNDGLNALSESGSGQSTIAGLGYGLPLSRAYAEYFGGGIAVQSLYGWGSDVFLTLQGVGTNR